MYLNLYCSLFARKNYYWVKTTPNSSDFIRLLKSINSDNSQVNFVTDKK